LTEGQGAGCQDRDGECVGGAHFRLRESAIPKGLGIGAPSMDLSALRSLSDGRPPRRVSAPASVFQIRGKPPTRWGLKNSRRISLLSHLNVGAVAQALLPVRDAWNAPGLATGRSACATCAVYRRPPVNHGCIGSRFFSISFRSRFPCRMAITCSGLPSGR
jgi:hypothetical protein